MTANTDAAEQLALTLIGYGLQRMTARVLAMLLFVEQETVTAGELAELLEASPGSISTALKSLSAVGLVEKVPAPGSRREHFRFPDEGWATLMSTQNAVVRQMQDAAETAIQTVGRKSLAGRRLTDMQDFYAYVMREMPAVIDRWRANRKRR
ncbi:GbsR/MarR family transcriptional regulator [Amycolatopsis sp. NPDC059021]|uniref:GbsR/MarR family transcriptional regulator n=1 Tax=Amycolatopsis sp. NPDC059021 TaxID=3346704 RepID=UPI00366BFC80